MIYRNELQANMKTTQQKIIEANKAAFASELEKMGCLCKEYSFVATVPEVTPLKRRRQQ